MYCTNLLACPICGESPIVEAVDELNSTVMFCCPNHDIETDSILREVCTSDDIDGVEISDVTYERLCVLWQKLVCEHSNIEYETCVFLE